MRHPGNNRVRLVEDLVAAWARGVPVLAVMQMRVAAVAVGRARQMPVDRVLGDSTINARYPASQSGIAEQE